MIKQSIFVFVLFLISFCILSCTKTELNIVKEETQTVTTELTRSSDDNYTGNVNRLCKKYTYVLVEDPDAIMPKKVCKVPGKDCRKKDASAIMTQYEWHTFFPDVLSIPELLRVDISQNREYMDYLEQTGFAQ